MRRSIVYIQYANPACYPPLLNSSRILADDDWEVLFLGTGSFGQSDVLSMPPHRNISGRRMRFCKAGWAQKFHYLRFVLWCIVKTLIRRPAWIYASDPLSCPIALILSYIPGFKVIYHEHDSPGDADCSGKKEINIFTKFFLRSRIILASRAKICILPNQKRLEQFSEETGRTDGLFCIWNCPRQAEAHPAAKPKPPSKGLSLYYHGVIDKAYLPVSILTAINKLKPNVRLTVVGYETLGSVGYGRFFMEEAARLGTADYVKILGPMDRKSLLDHCAAFDIGLALVPPESSDMNNRNKLGASNRPFDYLARGLALLISDLPDWRKIYVESGYGIACGPDDAESIVSSLEWFLKSPEEVKRMGERGRQRVLSEWNYERQFDGVARILDERQSLKITY